MREPENYFACVEIPASLKNLDNIIKNFGNEVVSTLKFKNAFLGVEVMLPLLKEDIMQFLNMQEIGSSIMMVYMRLVKKNYDLIYNIFLLFTFILIMLLYYLV